MEKALLSLAIGAALVLVQGSTAAELNDLAGQVPPAGSPSSSSSSSPPRGSALSGALLMPSFGPIPAGYRLLYRQDFARPNALRDFVFSDLKAWRIATSNGASALELSGKSDYVPQHRSPFNIALIADRRFTDFILEVELLSTVKPYPHQDMCLFYGFESTNQFYYTHLAVAADPHAHNIFVVNNAPRLAIASETTAGIEWGDHQWHRIRIERTVGDGVIKVFFDDFKKPLMRAQDKTFGAGFIGFGSFDDMGQVRNVRIWGPKVENRKTEFFQRGN